ncbi:MAG TPA: peptidylprolyl isomerase [Steroidobacteraceae bacterium]|jgi:peptidyl-prolyl cis-trans isomerase C|nr:peptidylprolyl isomerase [Steroidobacteraceae bacterium]
MKHLRILGLTAALVALAACQQNSSTTGQSSSSSPAASPTVATVDGTPIDRDAYEFYIKGITGKTSSDLSPEQRTQALDNLIRAQLLSQQAEKQGLDKQPETAQLIKMERLNILEQALSQKVLGDKQPTDDELKAEYDAEVAKLPKTEYHARHILVATQPFAEKIVDRLKKGEKFEDLAKAESMDSSKTNGGDLGWFTLDHMVKPFADAVGNLKNGQYTTDPVQTQYGWHVIQLLGTRPVSPPPFDQVKQRLVQVVQAKKFRAYTDGLLKQAKVETFLDAKTDSEGSGKSGAPDAPAAAPAAAPSAPAAPSSGSGG